MIKQWQRKKQIDAQIGSELYSFNVPISYIKLLDKAGDVSNEVDMILSNKSIYDQFNKVCPKESYEYFMDCGMELKDIERLFNKDKRYISYLVWFILSDELERIKEEEE